MAGKKQLMDFTTEELKLIPIDYITQHVNPLELLDGWSKLPYSYKANFQLQTALPCFVHWNNPLQKTQFDGPPPSQSRCPLCRRSLLK